jgi:signal transduction histidine kinase
MTRTILRNLISNAVKFTRRNGKVKIVARISHKFVDISVSDNGIGMSPTSISKLFRLDANMSTRGTDNEKGTGLGLFLCKEFVEKHGGKISVVSDAEKGSTFNFTMPLA